MTAAVDPPAFRRVATSMPPIPGIDISRTMTSGRRLPAASRAVRPSLAVPTTSKVDDKTAAAVSSISALSSTSSTRGHSDNVVPDCIPYQFRRGFDVELFHHLVFVKRDGAGREFQHRRHFFH